MVIDHKAHPGALWKRRSNAGSFSLEKAGPSSPGRIPRLPGALLRPFKSLLSHHASVCIYRNQPQRCTYMRYGNNGRREDNGSTPGMAQENTSVTSSRLRISTRLESPSPAIVHLYAPWKSEAMDAGARRSQHRRALCGEREAGMRGIVCHCMLLLSMRDCASRAALPLVFHGIRSPRAGV